MYDYNIFFLSIPLEYDNIIYIPMVYIEEKRYGYRKRDETIDT